MEKENRLIFKFKCFGCKYLKHDVKNPELYPLYGRCVKTGEEKYFNDGCPSFSPREWPEEESTQEQVETAEIKPQEQSEKPVQEQVKIAKRKPHREICHLCHEVNRVGFWVPDEIWRAALHESQWNAIVCLRCFTRLADERGVEWDKEIKFYPVSRITLEKDIEDNEDKKDDE